MEVATMTSSSFPTARMPSVPNLRTHRTLAAASSSSYIRASASSASLSTGILSQNVGVSFSSDFSGQKIRPASLNPFSSSTSRGKRSVVTMVIPFVRGSAFEQPPPDLPSYLFKNRIVYLGMPLINAVTQLILSEFMYLEYQDDQKPIYFYINSTGTSKDGQKYGYETEAFAIYDSMSFIKSPVFTLCVGNAWGEAALLLAAGAKGNRAALPSASIMIKQPISRFQGQATDVDIARKEARNTKFELVKLYAWHMGRKTMKQIAMDIRRPKYFTPSEAVEYGIIDKVLHTDRTRGGKKEQG